MTLTPPRTASRVGSNRILPSGRRDPAGVGVGSPAVNLTKAEHKARVRAFVGVEAAAQTWLDREIQAAYEAGVSARDLGRIVGVHHVTILRRYNRSQTRNHGRSKP